MDRSPSAYREIWNCKPALREIYSDIYRHMMAACVPGPILEIGAGSGNFKAFAPQAVTSDIMSAPWLDVVCDAQRLPFADASFANIAMVDVLHHVGSPLRFMQEAQRVLRPGGRLIMCEPAVTPVSHVLYRLFHDERTDMTDDPLADGTVRPDKDPWDSNQAIPTLLLGRYRDALSSAVPGLVLESAEHFALVAYALSGGFRPWSLLPVWLARPLLKIEWATRQLWGRLAGVRVLAVYRRVTPPEQHQ